MDIPGCRRGLAERPAKKPLSERSVRAPIPAYQELNNSILCGVLSNLIIKPKINRGLSLRRDIGEEPLSKSLSSTLLSSKGHVAPSDAADLELGCTRVPQGRFLILGQKVH